MRKGFTLIELLIVVLIIGILAAVAVPKYQKTVEKSHAAEGMTIVSTLAKAGKMYTLETGDQYVDAAKWSDLNINYDMAQPDQSASTAQTISGNWSCRFYDSYVGCGRQGGNISYELDYWMSTNLLSCMSSTDDGKAFCKILGCQFAGTLAGTPAYTYNCNQPGSGAVEQPYTPPPPCTPQCIEICPPVQPCDCPPPPPPCTPETVCPACDTPPCPCYTTACPMPMPCACPAPPPCNIQCTTCPLYTT